MLRVVSQLRTAEKDLIHVRAPALARPAPSRGSHSRSGGEKRGMGTGLGAVPLPLSLPGQAAFVPGGGSGQTPVRPQS